MTWASPVPFSPRIGHYRPENIPGGAGDSVPRFAV
jgi:hypothetical protein